MALVAQELDAEQNGVLDLVAKSPRGGGVFVLSAETNGVDGLAEREIETFTQSKNP